MYLYGSERNVVTDLDLERLNDICNGTDGYPSLKAFLDVDAEIGVKHEKISVTKRDNSSVTGHIGYSEKFLELCSCCTADSVKMREVEWLLEEVEDALAMKRKPVSYKYYFLGDNPTAKVQKIISSCVSKITENLKTMKDGFDNGNRIPSEYYTVLNNLKDNEITKQNVLDAIYLSTSSYKSERKASHTTKLRKQIQEVVATQFGITDMDVIKHNIWGEGYAHKKAHRCIRSRVRDICTRPIFDGVRFPNGSVDEKDYCVLSSKRVRSQLMKDYYVFAYREKWERSAVVYTGQAISCIYNVIANNMVSFAKFVNVEGSGVKQVYSKIRIENGVFKNCFKLIMIYSILQNTKLNAEMTEYVKNYITKYRETGVLADCLRDEIAKML